MEGFVDHQSIASESHLSHVYAPSAWRPGCQMHHVITFFLVCVLSAVQHKNYVAGARSREATASKTQERVSRVVTCAQAIALSSHTALPAAVKMPS